MVTTATKTSGKSGQTSSNPTELTSCERSSTAIPTISYRLSKCRCNKVSISGWSTEI